MYSTGVLRYKKVWNETTHDSTRSYRAVTRDGNLPCPPNDPFVVEI